MTNAISAVIIASAQSVAKVFLIGMVGYFSVKFPKNAPFLPRNLVGTVSRFTFHTLMLSLIYSTIAKAVTLESIGNYWFVVVGAFGVLGVSYVVATIMQCFIPIENKYDFRALRISVTFPNIVALPILIFPSLCEFPVIHEGYMREQAEGEDLSSQELGELCVSQANTFIFCYFISFMFLFWGLGYPQLMGAAKMKALEGTQREEDGSNDKYPRDSVIGTKDQISTAVLTVDDGTVNHDSSQTKDTNEQDDSKVGENESETGVFSNIKNACKQTFTSPGFLASLGGFITACIPPLQRALFEAEAPLRFLGSALESLGIASSSLSTIIVAASLVPPSDEDNTTGDQSNTDAANSESIEEERRNRMKSIRQSIMASSTRVIKAMTRSTPEMRRLHLWFCLSRLIISPAVVVGIVMAMDCGFDILRPVPKLALLVLIINSCLPGASLVVVLLKSKMVLEDTAMVVARAYFVCYITCIFTIAAWTAVGLWITLPDDDGNTFCQRR